MDINLEILEKYKDFLLARSLSLNYYYRIRIFLKFLEEKKLDYNNLIQEIIVQFLNEKKYNEQSKNSFINAGRDFYEFLGQKESEWNKLKLSKTEYKIPEYLTEKEVEQGISHLITYYSKKMTPLKIRALFHFIFYSAPRREEILTLKRENFDFVEGKVKFYGKGKKERYSYFPEKIGQEIQDYFRSENEEWNAFNIKIGKLNYCVRKIGKYLNKNIYPHLLRHSGAREMLRKGIPLSVVSKILGHSDIQTTMRYADENEEGRRNIYQEKMNDKKHKKG